MRQLTGSRRVWLVLALVCLPVVGAVLFHVGDTTTTSAEFADELTATLVASAILPLVLLLFGTSAFGNEVSEQTLGYLALKPLARWRIVAGKLAATLAAGGIPVAAAGFLAVAIVDDGGLGGAAATGVGLLVGAAAYAAIFTWAGLATRQALLVGLVYVFVWEAALAAYLDGVRFLSVRRYTLGLIHGLDGERLQTVEHLVGVGTAAGGAAIVVVVFTLLGVRRLRRMDVP